MPTIIHILRDPFARNPFRIPIVADSLIGKRLRIPSRLWCSVSKASWSLSCSESLNSGSERASATRPCSRSRPCVKAQASSSTSPIVSARSRLHIQPQHANAKPLLLGNEALVRFFQSRKNLHKRRLARAVAANESDVFPLVNGQRQFTQNGLRSKTFSDVLGGQNGLAGAFCTHDAPWKLCGMNQWRVLYRNDGRCE